MNNTIEITVGSSYFFNSLDEHHDLHVDKIALVDNTTNGWWKYIDVYGGATHYEWQKHTIGEWVDKLTSTNDNIRVSTFLVPDFINQIKDNLTIEEYFNKIKPLFNNLEDKYSWVVYVYNAYLNNKAFVLTDAQRESAYKMYKEGVYKFDIDKL